MNVLTDPPLPFVRKEMPQRQSKRLSGALRDISNQPAPSDVAEKGKRATKVKAGDNQAKVEVAGEKRKPAASRKRVKSDAGFTIFQDNPVLIEAQKGATSKLTDNNGTIENSKENEKVKGATCTRQRTRNSCASSAEREMITGVVTVNLPSQVTQVVPRRSSRGRKSLGSEENAPAAAVNVVAEKKATQSKKRKSVEVLNAAEPAVERSRTVVEGEVSVLPQAIEVKEAEAPELKKPRTFAKRVLNPAKCSEIIDRLYTNYYESETLYTPRPYMEKQSDINAKMRAILVDWIVEVHYKFKLHQSTLWLCVNILDRYLEQVPTVRSDLQLVGVSSLFIACKFEEVYPPEVKECVYITDYAYTREQVLAMESRILRQLDYRICVSTGYHFLTRYLTFIDASEQVRYLSCYYAERNLQEYEMLNVPPNKFAAYAVYAALSFRLPEDCVSTSSVPIVCEESVWTPALARLTGYGKDDLVAGASDLLKHVREEVVTASKRQLIAAKKKYAAEKYNSISSLPVPHIVVSGAEKGEAEAKE